MSAPSTQIFISITESSPPAVITAVQALLEILTQPESGVKVSTPDKQQERTTLSRDDLIDYLLSLPIGLSRAAAISRAERGLTNLFAHKKRPKSLILICRNCDKTLGECRCPTMGELTQYPGDVPQVWWYNMFRAKDWLIDKASLLGLTESDLRACSAPTRTRILEWIAHLKGAN